MTKSTPYLPTKHHYEILDGLRGVAALMVVIFHTFEAYANDNRFTQLINHGYLAVDFFFLLSGFVVAYAYDDRWGKMSQWDFYKRRLVRLQPMVIMGSIIGAALFYLQFCPMFSLVATTPVWKTLLFMVIGFTLIPVLPSMDIRGWQEMHPLDGPAWSLFFEYIANILYAIGFRKLSNKAMGVLVLLSAGLLIQLTVFGPRGDVIGGCPHRHPPGVPQNRRPPASLDEWALRSALHHRRLPAHRSHGRRRQRDRRLPDAPLQVLRRTLLPPLHHPLPFDLLVHRLGHPR
jgi:hypothetical protein